MQLLHYKKNLLFYLISLDGNILKKLDEVVVTNSIPLSVAAEKCRKIRQISISGLLAESIRRIATGDSVSSLFVD